MSALALSEKTLKKELTFIKDEVPGILRKRRGRGFCYYDADGNRVTDKETLDRINNLTIPPQWNEVWISPKENGYLQATGRDDKNRKQYIYHERFVAFRQNYKFTKLLDFGQQLPAIREATAGYLRQRKWTRDKVLALIVAILDDCGIRIGNESYKQQNGTVGLTTLRRKHLLLEGDKMVFDFPGKSNKQNRYEIADKRLMKLVKQCSELPGYEVFNYYDEDGKRCPVESEEVNQFIRKIAGEQFSSKDFRTWTATALTVYFYREAIEEINAHPRRKLDAVLVKKVAEELGNTPSVCRCYYIHPKVLDAAVALKIPEFEYNPDEESFFHSHDLRSWEKIALSIM